MRYLVPLLLLVFLAVSGAAMAEPIYFDSDSAPVNLEVACWVYVYFVNGPNADFYVEVEPGDGGACDVESIVAGHNCEAWLTGALTPPPGAPGQWDWYFIGSGQQVNLLGAGEWSGRLKVRVDGLTILDPAGVYPGGLMEIWISCVD